MIGKFANVTRSGDASDSVSDNDDVHSCMSKVNLTQGEQEMLIKKTINKLFETIRSIKLLCFGIEQRLNVLTG